MDDQVERLLTKDSFKALGVTLLLTGIGIALLAWQYQRLEERRQPQLEQELQEQQLVVEKGKARAVLDAFLASRLAGEEEKSLLYVTEEVQFQYQVGLLDLFESFDRYEIREGIREEDGSWRFQVSLQEEAFPPRIEIIRLTPLLDSYYIHQVQRAG